MRLKPIWTAEHSAYNTRRDKRNAELLQSAWRQWVGASQRVLGIGRLAAMLMLESVKLTKNAIALPFVSTRAHAADRAGQRRAASSPARRYRWRV